MTVVEKLGGGDDIEKMNLLSNLGNGSNKSQGSF